MNTTLTELAKTRGVKTGELERGASGDPIAELFHSLQMQSVFYTQAELSQPWGMDIPVIEHSLMFHFVVEGECLVDVEGERTRLRSGDFLMLPHGKGHTLMGAPGSRCIPLFDLPIETISGCYERLVYGGSGESTQLLCGAVSFDHPIAERLLSMMPASILIDSRRNSGTDFLASTVHMLASESTGATLGSEAVITRLADLLVIQSLREWLDHGADNQRGWLSALQDRSLSRALTAVHRDPGAPWTIEKMAACAGMSRTTFAAKFRQHMGQAPMAYVTEWRMALAKNRLQKTSDTVLGIALDLGYQSEAAFGRAYKKANGCTPGSERRGGC